MGSSFIGGVVIYSCSMAVCVIYYTMGMYDRKDCSMGGS